MAIYQKNPDAVPGSDFEPGALHHLVVGNTGRCLDPRRTPVSIVKVKPAVGTFVVRIEDFEDRGALWEEEFENTRHYQFGIGEARAGDDDVDSFETAIRKFDQPLIVPRDVAAEPTTRKELTRARETAGEWLETSSRFFKGNGRFPDPKRRRGDPKLYDDLKRYMEDQGVWDLEEAFARQFVSNPYSGELVKGPTVTLYRGLSTDTPIKALRQRTFVSASFSIEVAESHFAAAGDSSHGLLIRQRVPVERIFMTYLETASMNEQYLEAEAALLYEEDNLAF